MMTSDGSGMQANSNAISAIPPASGGDGGDDGAAKPCR